jgi:hypothetical protein
MTWAITAPATLFNLQLGGGFLGMVAGVATPAQMNTIKPTHVVIRLEFHGIVDFLRYMFQGLIQDGNPSAWILVRHLGCHRLSGLL